MVDDRRALHHTFEGERQVSELLVFDDEPEPRTALWHACTRSHGRPGRFGDDGFERDGHHAVRLRFRRRGSGRRPTGGGRADRADVRCPGRSHSAQRHGSESSGGPTRHASGTGRMAGGPAWGTGAGGGRYRRPVSWSHRSTTTSRGTAPGTDEDLSRLGGFLHSVETTRETSVESVRRRLWHRVPWLLVGLLGAWSRPCSWRHSRSLSKRMWPLPISFLESCISRTLWGRRPKPGDPWPVGRGGNSTYRATRGADRSVGGCSPRSRDAPGGQSDDR